MQRIMFLIKAPVIVFLSMLVISCDQRVTKNGDVRSETVKESTAIERTTALKPIPHPILEIEEIDKDQFYSTKQQDKGSRPVEKITDFRIVQKQLAGIVDFHETDGYLSINKINFRNGTLAKNEEQFQECSFVAYFPTEDILLLEGGHTIDVSFDLGTGQGTYDVGNPDLVTISPSGQYRLNKVFEGQECFDHFIQQKQQDKFQKIAELNEIFEKKTGKWLCVIEKEFWTDDNTLYFGLVTQYKEDGNEHEFYKVSVIDK